MGQLETNINDSNKNNINNNNKNENIRQIIYKQETKKIKKK